MPPLIQAITDLQRPNPQLASFGIKASAGGSHNCRTMMLAEITRLLALAPPTATIQEYSAAVVEQNVLGKNTESTRHKTFRYLRELYGLSPSLPLFAAYREWVRNRRRSA